MYSGKFIIKFSFYRTPAPLIATYNATDEGSEVSYPLNAPSSAYLFRHEQSLPDLRRRDP